MKGTLAYFPLREEFQDSSLLNLLASHSNEISLPAIWAAGIKLSRALNQSSGVRRNPRPDL